MIENLIVVHNLDKRTSQLYDVKLSDYELPLTQTPLPFKPKSHTFLTELIRVEEQ